VLLLIGNNFSDNVLIDNLPLAGKAVNQRGIAKDIDHSGDAAGGDRDQGTGLLGEEEVSRPHSFKAEIDVFCDLF
jgi:hypothetical protein